LDVIYDEEPCRLAVANGSSAYEALGLATAVAHGVESLYARPVKLGGRGRAGNVEGVSDERPE
jgi:hypothetical protein